MLVHKLRAETDAILVGRVTEERDKPLLNVREWSGRNPMKIVVDSSRPCFEDMDFSSPVLPQLMNELYNRQVQSLLVEGGAKTLQSFIDAGLWDEIRIETAPVKVAEGTKAPALPAEALVLYSACYDGRRIVQYVPDGQTLK